MNIIPIVADILIYLIILLAIVIGVTILMSNLQDRKKEKEQKIKAVAGLDKNQKIELKVPTASGEKPETKVTRKPTKEETAILREREEEKRRTKETKITKPEPPPIKSSRIEIINPRSKK